MKDISNKVLHAIRDKDIMPKPKWQFLLQRWLVWSAAAFSVLLGGIAVSVMAFRMANSDWEIIQKLPQSPFSVVLSSLPYVWIVVLALFIALAYYNVRHTRRAYKYHAYWIVVGSMAASILLGTGLYALGLGPQVDQFVNQRAPFMQDVAERRLQRWAQPQQGLLAGEIVELGNNDVALFTLSGLDGNEWDVRRTPDFQMPPKFMPTIGDHVRLTGAVLDSMNNVFVADAAYPLFRGPGIHGGRAPRHMFPAGPPHHGLK